MSQPTTAMDDIERLVRASGRAGMGPVPIAKARGVKRPSVERPLQRLLAAGRLVNRRTSTKSSLYYAPEFAPEVMAPAQRTTSIRDANVTMPMGGEPIITPATKVTRAEPVPGRFEFKPPPGWRGQITSDWLQAGGRA